MSITECIVVCCSIICGAWMVVSFNKNNKDD